MAFPGDFTLNVIVVMRPFSVVMPLGMMPLNCAVPEILENVGGATQIPMTDFPLVGETIESLSVGNLTLSSTALALVVWVFRKKETSNVPSTWNDPELGERVRDAFGKATDVPLTFIWANDKNGKRTRPRIQVCHIRVREVGNVPKECFTVTFIIINPDFFGEGLNYVCELRICSSSNCATFARRLCV